MRDMGLKVALICNTGATPGVTQRVFLEREGLIGFFDTLTFSDEERLSKPAKAIFDRTLERIGSTAAAHNSRRRPPPQRRRGRQARRPPRHLAPPQRHPARHPPRRRDRQPRPGRSHHPPPRRSPPLALSLSPPGRDSCLFSPREKIEMRGHLATATGHRSPPHSRSRVARAAPMSMGLAKGRPFSCGRRRVLVSSSGALSVARRGPASPIPATLHRYFFMAITTLTASPRALFGKRSRYLRRAGITPANLYGAGIDSTALQVDSKTLVRTIVHTTRNTPVSLQIEGEADPRTIFIWSVQRDPPHRGRRPRRLLPRRGDAHDARHRAHLPRQRRPRAR